MRPFAASSLARSSIPIQAFVSALLSSFPRTPTRSQTSSRWVSETSASAIPRHSILDTVPSHSHSAADTTASGLHLPQQGTFQRCRPAPTGLSSVGPVEHGSRLLAVHGLPMHSSHCAPVRLKQGQVGPATRLSCIASSPLL